MSLIITNYGKLQLLDKMLGDTLEIDENYILKLFQNDVSPGPTTIIDHLTEADFTGYEEKILTRGGWLPANLVGEAAESVYNEVQSWTCGVDTNTIYGYWIEAETSGTILWGERFEEAKSLIDGDILELTLRFRLDSF